MRLLDTSIAVEILRGNQRAKEAATKRQFCVSWITMGELLAGAYWSSFTTENLTGIARLCDGIDVVYPDEATCDRYGRIWAVLAKAGTPLPLNDVWQAALAIQRDMILIAHDKHLEQIGGLKIEDWLAS